MWSYFVTQMILLFWITLSSTLSFLTVPWPTDGILDNDSSFLFRISTLIGPEIYMKGKTQNNPYITFRHFSTSSHFDAHRLLECVNWCGVKSMQHFT